MPNDESLRLQRHPETESISSDAEEWSRIYVKYLELEFGIAASQLPTNSSPADFQRAMMTAVVKWLRQIGVDPEEIVRLFQESADLNTHPDENIPWTSELNTRRLGLIDKAIQQTITIEEVIELERLTARMRAYCDREEMVPLEGARLLHRRLLGMADSGGMPK